MSVLLRRGLVEDGHAVDVASDGPEALWLAREGSYAAIVLDVMLPGIDGFEVTRKLREERNWTPVLLLTARTEVADRVEGLDAGADDYLTKPFSFTELCARIRALVRRGVPERPTALAVGDLRLDPAHHRAWRGGVELQLSPKEFSLLELFMRNPGVVITRTRAIEHVWDFAYAGTSNIVDQYIRYLREKIDLRFQRADLETVRGVGYRLRDPVVE